MWTLWTYCKSRYSENDLKTQTENMPAETRQSLTEKIAQTLDEAHSDEDGVEGRNMQDVLDQVELDLESANKQLKVFEGKEDFLAVRIRKYQEALKQQEEHLEELRKHQEENESNNESNSESNGKDEETKEQEQRIQQKRQHYQEQVEKQLKNKEALGKVVDIHMGILKHIKGSKRTIAGLEQKKYDLTIDIKKCREFLVMAEEAEREQQRGILGNAADDGSENGNRADTNDLAMMEVAPLGDSGQLGESKYDSQQQSAEGDEEAADLDSKSIEGKAEKHDENVSKALTEDLAVTPQDGTTKSTTLEVPTGAQHIETIPKVEPEELADADEDAEYNL